MRRIVLLASLLASQLLLSGCFTGANVLYLDALSEPRVERVEVTPVRVSALRTTQDEVEVAVVYEDGLRRGVRLNLSQGTSASTALPVVTGSGQGLPISRDARDAGLSLSGGVLRWREPGRAPIAVNLARGVERSVEPSTGQRVGRGFKQAAFVVTLPLALGLDAATFPLQALGLWIYKQTGGSFLSFG